MRSTAASMHVFQVVRSDLESFLLQHVYEHVRASISMCMCKCMDACACTAYPCLPSVAPVHARRCMRTCDTYQWLNGLNPSRSKNSAGIGANSVLSCFTSSARMVMEEMRARGGEEAAPAMDRRGKMSQEAQPATRICAAAVDMMHVHKWYVAYNMHVLYEYATYHSHWDL